MPAGNARHATFLLVDIFIKTSTNQQNEYSRSLIRIAKNISIVWVQWNRKRLPPFTKLANWLLREDDFTHIRTCTVAPIKVLVTSLGYRCIVTVTVATYCRKQLFWKSCLLDMETWVKRKKLHRMTRCALPVFWSRIRKWGNSFLRWLVLHEVVIVSLSTQVDQGSLRECGTYSTNLSTPKWQLQSQWNGSIL